MMTLQEIDDLETKIYGLEMPVAPFELHPGTVITDIEQFLEAQFVSLRFDPAAKVSLPCLWRLERFIELVEAQQSNRE